MDETGSVSWYVDKVELGCVMKRKSVLKALWEEKCPVCFGDVVERYFSTEALGRLIWPHRQARRTGRFVDWKERMATRGLSCQRPGKT